MICTRGDTLIRSVAADMISWAKFRLFWWSAETHFNIQNKKNPYAQKINQCKIFPKGDHSACKEGTKQLLIAQSGTQVRFQMKS